MKPNDEKKPREETLPYLTPEQQQIVRDNLGLVYSMVEKLKRSSLVAAFGIEDAQQEGVIALGRAAAYFDPSLGTKFASYACVAIERRIVAKAIRRAAISRHLSLDQLDPRTARYLEPAAPEGDGRASPDTREIVERLLARLPAIDAGIVRMYFGIGCRPISVRKIARVCHRHRSRIHKRLSLALARLRQWLEKEENDVRPTN